MGFGGWLVGVWEFHLPHFSHGTYYGFTFCTAGTSDYYFYDFYYAWVGGVYTALFATVQ